MFSAITEELGGLFAICVILVCMSCYIMFVNIAMRLSKPILPSGSTGTGNHVCRSGVPDGRRCHEVHSDDRVTLPLVSYGGSSMLSTVMMFAIIQGLYILREDEEEQIEIQRRKRMADGTGKNLPIRPLTFHPL